MMRKSLLKSITLLFTMGLIMVSCDDVSLDQPSVDTSAAQENAKTSKAVGEVFSAIENGLSGLKSLPSCPAISYELVTGKLKVDYGVDGCSPPDVVTKKGIIYAQITGYQQGWGDGTSAVVTFVDFYIDDAQLTGSMTITAHVINNITSYTIDAVDMALTFSDASKVQWNSTITMTLLSKISANKYWSISGTSEGTSRKGVSFTNISDQLETQPDCNWFVDGTLTITAANNVDVLTFSEDCGTVTIKHNKLPAITVNLDNI